MVKTFVKFVLRVKNLCKRNRRGTSKYMEINGKQLVKLKKYLECWSNLSFFSQSLATLK